MYEFWRLEAQIQRVDRVVLPETPGENPFLASSRFWELWAFPDLWPHHSSLCPCGHMASTLLHMCQVALCLSLTRTHDSIQGPPDYPGQASFSKSITKSHLLPHEVIFTSFGD